MDMKLNEVLLLVGQLDDSEGDDTPRERFRRFLHESIRDIGQVRDYVEDCLRYTGPQYNRALQDLVNHIGHFLEFEVTYGRYQGVSGQIGFDGLWKSSTGVRVVVEVKTSEAYAIKTNTLVGYINDLVSEQEIPSQDEALGLYVLGRPDPELRQLQNSIVAEKRTDQLRMISVESLLTLAELMNEYDVGHEDVLAVIRPSGPSIDSIVDIMARLVAQPSEEQLVREPQPSQEYDFNAEAAYWITPVASDEEATSEEVIYKLVGQEEMYAFGDRTPGRKHLKPGDWMCFYASGKGVVAHAQVISEPAMKPNPRVRHPDKYPWTFELANPELYLDEPIVIDAALRGQLDAFEGRDPSKSWSWFVQATRKISRQDFEILTH
jgi:hypothetical protein